MNEFSIEPGGQWNRFIAWVLNLVVIAMSITFFWWLSDLALERHLLLQAAHDQQQLENGWRWEFDSLSDLVGRSATELKSVELEQGHLSGYRGGQSGFISLNFNGQRLDANLHHILQIRIWLQRPAPLGIFHTESLDGAVISTPAVELQAGWQLIVLDLGQASWQANTYLDRKQVSGPHPARWGGQLGAVSSLRLHPSMRPNNQFKIDWVRLISSAPIPWSMRATVELASLDETQLETALDGLRAPLIIVPVKAYTVERILEFRDHIKQTLVAASLMPDTAAALGDPESFQTGHTWLTLVLAWLVGVAAILTTIAGATSQAARAIAMLQLTALLALIATLLTWTDTTISDDPALAVTLGILVALALALLAQSRKSLISKLKVSYRSNADTAMLITACIVPLFVLALSNDQLSQPNLDELLPRLGRYVVWASLQQLVLCIILLNLMSRLGCSQRSAVKAASCLFGLVHFPNFALMAGTLVLAQLCLWLYRRHDSLIPGIAAHAILGTLYLELMPVGILRSGAIGMRFFF